MIKAVFFDAIDTLFMSYPSKVGLYVRILKKVTGKNFSEKQVSLAWAVVFKETEKAGLIESRGKGRNMAWVGFNANLLRQLGITEGAAEMGERLKFESWGNPENYRLFSDVNNALVVLKQQGIFVGCVSNEDGWLPDFFTHFGIDKDFSFILASEQIGFEKPEPEIFEKALEISGFKAHEVLFVGDSLISDYFGSKAVGMKAVLIDREHKVADDSICKIDSLEKIQELL